MLRASLLTLLLLPLSLRGAELDASETLFTVLAAVNAAGYDAEIESPTNHPARLQVRQHLAQKNIPVLPELRRFLEPYKTRSGAVQLSQYVSFALSLDGPPSFNFKARTLEVPPDALALDGLRPLIAKFYSEADIPALWKQAQPVYDAAIARYSEPVIGAIQRVNAFLRVPTGQFLGRRFQIYVDLLGAPNQVQSRSYGDDYYVVVTPAADPQVSDIRHGYLHYILDPLTTKFSADVETKKSLIDYASGAPALEDAYKEDFLLLVTESLIKALEARFDRRPAEVDAALKEGYILAPFFAEHLPVYEKQEQAMRLYFPDMIKAIDARREDARLSKVEFAKSARIRHARPVRPAAPVELTGARKTLEDAEKAYGARDLEKARGLYTKALEETAEPQLHAQGWYGLARVAILNKDPETGEKLLHKALESSPDPYVKGWTLVYLGRLSDAAGEREEAVRHYRAAMAVDGASAAARKAAELGLAKP